MNQKHHWKRTFFTIASGQAVSMIGSSAVQFALIWWLAEQTASPLVMGLSGLAAFLPMTVLSPFAGIAADRWNRKYISVISDLSMGVMALIYAAVLYVTDAPAWSVLFILFLRGVGGTFQQPAIQSIIPQLVPSDELVRVNGWMQLLTSGSFILGPVIGAAMYAALPMPVILLTDFAGALAASLTLGFAHIPPLVRTEAEDGSFFAQFREGLAIYRKDRALLYLVAAQALCMLFFAPLSSFYPLMTSDYFDLSALYGSIVEMGFAAGMMLSALLFTRRLHVMHKLCLSYLGLFGLAATTMLCGLVPNTFSGWLVFAVACAGMGACGNVHSIPLTAYMQETIAPDKMGRAFALLGQISALTMPVGLLIGSPIAEQIGVHRWFLISGIGIAATVGLVLLVERLRRPA